MKDERKALYTELEQRFNSKTITYVTSHREGMETSIGRDVLPFFAEHLDTIKKADKISLFLITNGGDTLTAWSLVNLIRSYCKSFEVIIPANCFSSGTLISLGANTLVMTKQATLGPIDPSVTGALNPVVPGTNMKVPVSVEFVNAYIEMAKNLFGIHDEKNLTEIFLHLSEKIHPLALGQVYRSRQQIQMLAHKLLSSHAFPQEKEENVIKFLCSESGSHDYAIRRKEAIDSLGLNVVIPDDDQYSVIKKLYNDISSELEFNNPYNPETILGAQANVNYSCRRCIIESLTGGTDVLATDGELSRVGVGTPPLLRIQDRRTFEGWRHES